MTRFWEIAARHWAPALESWEWSKALGAERVQRLVDAKVLHPRPLRGFDAVPCLECRRDARIIWEAGEAIAICTGDFLCTEMPLGPAPMRLALDERDFVRRLAEALGLVGSPGEGRHITPLGRRQLGDEWVAIDLVPHPDRSDVPDAIHLLVRGGPPVRLLLVPHSARLRGDLPTEVAGVELLWVGLDEFVRIEKGIVIDWTVVTSRRRFAGLPLARPFAGLLVRTDGFGWAGGVPDRQPTPAALRLLRVLADHPSAMLTRRRLSASVWPDEHTAAGGLPRGVNPDAVDRRLRNLVVELRELLGEERIETRRGKAGGYLLALSPELVRVA